MGHVLDETLERTPSSANLRSSMWPFGVSMPMPGRSSVIFEAILLPYLSGKAIFPLDKKARAALVHCCKPGEDLFEVLHAEACVWEFNRLQGRVLQEMQTPPREADLDEREAKTARTARESVTRMRLQRQLSRDTYEGEDTENVLELLHIPKDRLTRPQMGLVRRFHASHRRVQAWLDALRREGPPAKPSNSSLMIMQGWRVGLMYYRSNAIHHAPVIPDEYIAEKDFVKEGAKDIRESAPGAKRSRGVVYLLNSEQNEDTGVISFARQSAATYSTGVFRNKIIEESRRTGGRFHGCMQNLIGRHGLQVVCKTSWIAVLRDPLIVLSGCLLSATIFGAVCR
ncbi:hypothetical protein P389DRAFT_17641 [Cystobasidium minutum MCA 4210]|uniref:uncharacterized protein n=1 Tax=Cystobasidium minutum MCA 4210 TaxID=1397322 RepID=UPI0034CD7CA5|eukprot:jgi/Rhomi1/17641/CE17640_747